MGKLFLLVWVVVWLALTIVIIAGVWKTFEKAGKPGWACLIPLYNVWVLLEMAGKPGWWLLLMLIPLVNFVVALIALIALAERFGKGAGFGIGLALLGFIFFPILGFGDAQYRAAG